MTRINTNVSSLVAQNTLGRSNASLNEALTRLSTGLRINTGKDDPAGLIASENLRSDITSIRRAISNTDRANQVIATADSALGQVSSLLNDIRGLVTESANTGVLSAEQIAANQLQLDSSLEALNRIAQTTEFQGRKLLNGSLNFNTTGGANFNRVTDLQIDQANLGATGSVAVNIAISSVATRAQVDVANIPTATAAVSATSNIDATNTVVQAAFDLTFDTSGEVITITTQAGGEVVGSNGNGITVIAVEDATVAGGVNGAATLYNDTTNTLTIAANFASGTVTDTEVKTVVDAINGGNNFVVTGNSGANLAAADVGTYSSGSGIVYTTTGRDAGDADILVTSTIAGTSGDGTTITLVENASIGTGSPTASYDSDTDVITVTVDDSEIVSLAAITSAIDSLLDFSATLTVNSGDGNYNATTGTAGSAGANNINAAAAFAGGVNASGGIAEDVVFELAGAKGSEVFNVKAGASIAELVSQINLVSDATGVTAVANGTTLEITSSAYGLDAFVDLSIVSEGPFTVRTGTFTDAVGGGSRQTGTDVVAKINGIDATGTGNSLKINTATLDLNVDVAVGFIGNIGFTITGGGALFQLGPDVVSNQQARIGITSVNTAQLGGVSGSLFQLGTGGSAELSSSNLDTAAAIVEEAINQVTSLRGRLGAFQRTTLETNKNALNDTLVNLTEAESSIRDADFARESAALTRAQILVQSGTTVLQIANSNPQNVLALLR
jgi:flagellin